MQFARVSEVASDVVPGWKVRRGPRTVIFVDPDGDEAGRTQQAAWARIPWTQLIPTEPSTLVLPDGPVQVPAERVTARRIGRGIAFTLRDRHYAVWPYTDRSSGIQRDGRPLIELTRRSRWSALTWPYGPRVTAEPAKTLDGDDALVVLLLEFCLVPGRPQTGTFDPFDPIGEAMGLV